jgi:hypothetical protein
MRRRCRRERADAIVIYVGFDGSVNKALARTETAPSRVAIITASY